MPHPCFGRKDDEQQLQSNTTNMSNNMDMASSIYFIENSAIVSGEAIYHEFQRSSLYLCSIYR
jgi:hypothetical protein